MKDEARRALDDAKRLATQGDYQAALDRHVWFHAHALDVDSSYYGVRLSFALAYWVELGGKYPRALKTLKTIRDQSTSRLLAGESNRDLFNEVESINQHLAEFKPTVELFKQIEAANPAFASHIYDLAAEALVQEREYALARKYLGAPENRLAAARGDFQEGMQDPPTGKVGDASRQAYESIFTENVLQIIKVLQETGDIVGAKNIQAEALKTLNNEAIRNVFNP